MWQNCLLKIWKKGALIYFQCFVCVPQNFFMNKYHVELCLFVSEIHFKVVCLKYANTKYANME